MQRCISIFMLLTLTSIAEAKVNLTHESTATETAAAYENNEKFHREQRDGWTTNAIRPYEDTSPFAYVLMSAFTETREVQYLRRTIAQNLPEGVNLVILADKSDSAAIKKEYSKYISTERLIVATDDDTGNGFWARDSFPVPVYTASGTALVAAKYYRDFTSWDAIANSVSGAMEKQKFTFVGGNLLADEDGNCFSVDSYRMYGATSKDIISAYGCKTHHMMPYAHGIGDVDEVLKPLSGKRMLTNTAAYRKDLEALGYEVIMMPELDYEYRTYINSLVVNGTVFMPSYGLSEDSVAQKAYEELGYKVFQIPSSTLSDDYHGSVHCQTMAYPMMSKEALLKALQLKEI